MWVSVTARDMSDSERSLNSLLSTSSFFSRDSASVAGGAGGGGSLNIVATAGTPSRLSVTDQSSTQYTYSLGARTPAMHTQVEVLIFNKTQVTRTTHEPHNGVLKNLEVKTKLLHIAYNINFASSSRSSDAGLG